MTTDELNDQAQMVHDIGSLVGRLLARAAESDGRAALARSELRDLDKAYTELSMVISLCYAERRLKAVG